LGLSFFPAQDLFISLVGRDLYEAIRTSIKWNSSSFL
jgi:hypothetical protein